jgi:chemotaxis protein MotC
MRFSRRICGAVLALLWLAGTAGAAEGESEEDAELAPYQMVRSLQLLQDRIAAGDHAALPMQRKLLEMIDQRFRRTSSEDFVDERNYEALLVYAMSGGNPATMDSLLMKLHLEETDRSLGTGVLGYLRGDVATARAALDPVDPLTLAPEVGAFFALVKGSVITSQDPKEALKMFDEARLLSPGSLVEEAALRRTMNLAQRGLEASRFLSAAGQYVRRYLRSPYASQFADALVSGIVALNQTIDLDELDTVISGMDPEQQKVVYLRLARRAAIDGMPGLAEYASNKADAVQVDEEDPSSDPRGELYSSLAVITSDTVDQVLPKLRAIDRSRLSESDRKLLDAAMAIATEVTARPDTSFAGEAAVPARSGEGEKAHAAPAHDGLPEAEPLDASEAGAQAPSHDGGGASAETKQPQAEPPALETPPASEASTEHAAAVQRAAQPHATTEADAAAGTKAAGGTGVDADPTSAVVEDARKKLDEIDQLLKDAVP